MITVIGTAEYFEAKQVLLFGISEAIAGVLAGGLGALGAGGAAIGTAAAPGLLATGLAGRPGGCRWWRVAFWS